MSTGDEVSQCQGLVALDGTDGKLVILSSVQSIRALGPIGVIQVNLRAGCAEGLLGSPPNMK